MLDDYLEWSIQSVSTTLAIHHEQFAHAVAQKHCMVSCVKNTLSVTRFYLMIREERSFWEFCQCLLTARLDMARRRNRISSMLDQTLSEFPMVPTRSPASSIGDPGDSSYEAEAFHG